MLFPSTGKMASFVVDSKVLEKSEFMIIPGSSLFTGPPNTDMLALKLFPLSKQGSNLFSF